MKRLLLVGLLCVSGCSDADKGQWSAIGSEFKVTVYSGGTAVRTFISSGKVATESKSDGWYFTEKQTGKLIRLSGTVVVEQL